MIYALNGFFAGLITGGTFFLVRAHPGAETVDKHGAIRPASFFVGVGVGIMIVFIGVVFGLHYLIKGVG